MFLHHSQPFVETPYIVFGKSPVAIRQQHETKKHRILIRCGNERLSGMKQQSALFKKTRYRVTPSLQLSRVVVKQSEIIDIPHITFCAQYLLAVMIESIQVDVGKKRAREVADRDAAPVFKGNMQVVARKMQVDRFLETGIAVEDESAIKQWTEY